MFERIRFLKSWHGFLPGATTDTVTPGAADLLVRRGVAVIDRPEPVAGPAAAGADQSPSAPPAPEPAPEPQPVRRRRPA